MKLFIFTLCLIISTSAFTQQQPWCGLNYRFESYHLGLANKYLDKNSKRPQVLDEMCWRLGSNDAIKLLNRRDSSGKCLDVFLEGEQAGLEGDLLNSRSPQECFNAGRSYGLVQLRIFAREKNYSEVGRDCIQEYINGKNNALNDYIPSPPSNKKLQFCYMAGHNDGTLFRGLL
ncbi:MAG: hypothetical protein HOJ35_08645 [Bdellovibrionales bacterium]|jgi:hypothetical protein|nr:hypothetical protein [Bdellovibrionales bacterium]